MRTDPVEIPNHGMRIAGETVGADRGGERCIVVRNPFTREAIARVPKATLAEVRRAFEIAQAFRPRLTRFERAAILDRCGTLVHERSAQVASLISVESGLSLKDATYEAGRVADVLHFG